MAFWVTFEDGYSACVEVEYVEGRPFEETVAEVTRQATEIRQVIVTKVETLPYPANPRLIKVTDPKYGACPSFCYTPDACAGKSSCPRSYSCVD